MSGNTAQRLFWLRQEQAEKAEELAKARQIQEAERAKRIDDALKKLEGKGETEPKPKKQSKGGGAKTGAAEK
jgi:hypothetical protein